MVARQSDGDDRAGASGPEPAGTRVAVISPFRSRGETRGTLPQVVTPLRRPFDGPLLPQGKDPARVWESLTALTPPRMQLLRTGLAPLHDRDATSAAMDLLRARILPVLTERAWTRLGIAAPTPGCGASFVTLGLGMSLSRLPALHTLMVDLDLRRPGLARLLGIEEPGRLSDLLTDDQPIESVLWRMGSNLALALNAQPFPDPAVVLQDEATARALDGLAEVLQPDVVLYDLPPVLASDDVIAFAPQMDALLLVADGSRTTAEDIRRCECLLDGRVPILGVVLNRAQDESARRLPPGR